MWGLGHTASSKILFVGLLGLCQGSKKFILTIPKHIVIESLLGEPKF